MSVSRRAVLGLAAAALAAGCSRAARSTGATSVSADGSATSGTPSLPAGAGSSGPALSPSRSPIGPVGTGPAIEYAHGPRTRNEVAVTFHGAGEPTMARQLLAIFAAHKAQMTVLGVGSWLAANPAIAREIVKAGHELGNHTYNHLDIDKLDAPTARAEIVRCRELLATLVGSGGASFRPSQAQSATPLVRRLAGEAGYRVCLSYDIDSLDYTDPGVDAVRANVARARPGSIVSMHFGHSGTLEAMPHILDDLAARALRPVTATTLLRP